MSCGDNLVLRNDFVWVRKDELYVGNEILAFDEGRSPHSTFRAADGSWKKLGKQQRHISGAIVRNIDCVETKVVDVLFSNGYEITLPVDKFILARTSKDGLLKWIKVGDLIKRQAKVIKYLNTWGVSEDYRSGWLSGFIEGEGSLKVSRGKSLGGIEVCQRPTVTWDKCLRYLAEIGVKHSPPAIKVGGVGRGDCQYIYTSGKWSTVELIGKLQISRFIDKLDFNAHFGCLSSVGLDCLTVISIQNERYESFCTIKTSTKTYFENGFAVHDGGID